MKKWLLAWLGLGNLAGWAQTLPEQNWDPWNRARLNGLLQEYGRSGPNFSEHRPPYAVFDWDNTSIFLDVEEATLNFQVSQLRFAATPAQLETAIRTGVPERPFVKAFNNQQGQSVDIEAVAQDIRDSYEWLYQNYRGLAGRDDLASVQRSPHYANFTSKMRYLYEALDATYHGPVAYPWSTYLFVGMTREQVQQLTREAVHAELAHPIDLQTWLSPAELPGRAGVVSVSFKRGLRLLPEMQQLYRALTQQGFEIWVCSASFVDVVAEIAGNPEFGYGIPAARVLALELERDPQGRILAQPRAGYEQTYGTGKTAAVRRRLVAHYGYDPVLVAGDSQGDENILADFRGMRLGLIINLWRDPSSLLGDLCRRAVKDYGKAEAIYLLQGRDDNRGQFLPGQARVPLGGAEPRVFGQPNNTPNIP